MVQSSLWFLSALLWSSWLVAAESQGKSPTSVPIVFAGTSIAGSLEKPSAGPLATGSGVLRPTATSHALKGTPNALSIAPSLQSTVSPTGPATLENIQGLVPTTIDTSLMTPIPTVTPSAATTPASDSDSRHTTLIIAVPAALGTASLLLLLCFALYSSRMCVNCRIRQGVSGENRHAAAIGDDEIETWRVASDAGLRTDNTSRKPRSKHRRILSTARTSAVPSEKPIEEYAAAVIPAMAFVPQRPPVLINIQRATGSRQASSETVDHSESDPFNTPKYRTSSKLDQSAPSLSIGQSECSSMSGGSARPLTLTQPLTQPPPARRREIQRTELADSNARSISPILFGLPSRPGSFDFEIDFDTAPTSPKHVG